MSVLLLEAMLGSMVGFPQGKQCEPGTAML